LPVAPLDALAQPEEIRETVARDAEVVGHGRHDVELPVDHQEPAEDVLCEARPLGRVDVPGDDVRRLPQRRLQTLGRLASGLLRDATRERLVVHLLGPLEVEGDVVGERHLEEGVAHPLVVADAGEERPRLAVVLQRLLVGVDGARSVPGLEQVLGGLLRLIGLAEVAGEQAVRLLGRFAVDLFERLADALVELPALRVDEARIRHLLHETVTEAVLRVRPPPLLHDEVETLELREGVHELIRRDEPLEEREAERPADDGREGESLACPRVEAVEAGLESALDERGDGELVLFDAQLPAAVLSSKSPPLDEVAERLLEEEGVAARPLSEEVGDRFGQLALGGVRDERPARIVRKRPHLDLAKPVRVLLSRPLAQTPRSVLPLGPVEEEKRHGGDLGHAEELLEELERGLICPVQVLEDEAERLLVGEAPDELVEDLEGAHLDRLAVQLPQSLRRVRLEREPEESGEERIGLVRVLPSEEVRELGFELEPDAGFRSGGAHLEPLAQKLPDRPVRKRLRVGDAARLDEADAVAVGVPRLPDEPGLANPGLAGDRDDRAPSLHERVHRALQDRELELAPDQRECRRLGLRLPEALDAERLDGPADALELLLAEVFELDGALDLALGRGADDDAAAARDLLQAVGDVDGLAERVPGVVPVQLAPLDADDDRPGVHADPHREVDAVGRFHLVRVLGDCTLDRERRADRALGVVLVRDRGAEEGEHLVADELRHRPVEAADLLGHDAHDLVDEELRALRAELLADRRRADDVGHEHRDDSPLPRRNSHTGVIAARVPRPARPGC
jgi:hypothetical protein